MAAQLPSMTVSLFLGLMISCTPTPSFMHPKVPQEQLAELQKLTNPLPKSYWIIDDGKTLYEGKGMCLRCHGRHGDGKGEAAGQFQTLPRNLKNQHFWTQRSEGELFWIIKNGSPGTGMREFKELLTDQEIWKILRYTETFPTTSYPSEPIKPIPPPKSDLQQGFY